MEEFHRDLGPGLPALNVDCVEYAGTKPVAIMEYKHSREEKIGDWQKESLFNLAKLSKLPLFLVFYYTYSDGNLLFKIVGLNNKAKNFLKKEGYQSRKIFREEDYREFLLNLRK